MLMVQKKPVFILVLFGILFAFYCYGELFPGILIDYSDDVVNENIIIKSDSDNYYGLGVIDVYFSVENVSGEDKGISIIFNFLDDSFKVSRLERLVENVIDISSTTKEEIISYVYDDVVIYDIIGEVGRDKDIAKDLKGRQSLYYFPEFILDGEILYYRARIEFDKSGEEFIIEAVGLNAYGYLHPTAWSDVIDFESPTYSTGLIHNQDSWNDSNSAWYVVSTSTLEGDQSVWVQGQASGYSTYRATTASNDDTIYIRYSSDIQNVSNAYISLRDSGDWVLYVWFDTGKIWVSDGGTAKSEDTGLTYSTSTNGILKIIYDTETDNDFSIDYCEGGSWQGVVAANSVNSTGDIEQLRFGITDSSGGSQSWFDDVAITDGCSEEEEEEEISNLFTEWIDEVQYFLWAIMAFVIFLYFIKFMLLLSKTLFKIRY